MDNDDTNQREDDRPRIKVTDRRKFAADGTPRAGAEEHTVPSEQAEPSAAQEPAAEPADPSATAEATATPSAPESPQVPDNAAEAAAPEEGDSPAETAQSADASGLDPSAAGISQLPRDFSAFVESMYFEAMLYMGAIADPRTGESIEDIELSKYKIDLLSMLAEKTEGNLTADEQRQLDEVLYQLRMLYLQKTKVAKL
jgi:hypothetical protein